MVTNMLNYQALLRGNNFKGANTLKTIIDNEAWAQEIATIPEAMAQILGEDMSGGRELRLLPGVWLTGKHSVGLGLSNFLKTLNPDFDTLGGIAAAQTFKDILDDKDLKEELFAFPKIFERLFSPDMFDMAIEYDELSFLLYTWLMRQTQNVGRMLIEWAQPVPRATDWVQTATTQANIDTFRNLQTFENVLANTSAPTWEIVGSNDKLFKLFYLSPYIVRDICGPWQPHDPTIWVSRSRYQMYGLMVPESQTNSRTPTDPNVNFPGATPMFMGNKYFQDAIDMCVRNPQIFTPMPVAFNPNPANSLPFHDLANNVWQTARVAQSAVYFWKRAMSVANTAGGIQMSNRQWASNTRIWYQNAAAVGTGVDVYRFGFGNPHLNSNWTTEAEWTTDPDNPQGIAFMVR